MSPSMQVSSAPGQYNDFDMVPLVDDHEPPYLYTVNFPHFGGRFQTKVFQNNKDTVKCQWCGWTGKIWLTFAYHLKRRCLPSAEEKNVSIQREVLVDIVVSEQNEMQLFNCVQELPPVKESEPPYDYVCSTTTWHNRFRDEIFRKGIDFIICDHCDWSYQNVGSFNEHYRKKHRSTPAQFNLV